MSCQKSKPEPPPSKSAFDPHSTLKAREVFGQQANFEIRVNPGSPAEAILYAQHISDELGIKVDDNLDSVLKFCGYGELTGRDAEITPSDQLMKRFPGDVVAARFFAPKIIDVSDVGAPAGKKPLGWRKVVRLRVRANSLAAAKGIAAMFLLFNVFQERSDVAKDPFSPCVQNPNGGIPCSQNNQVMLIVDSPQVGKDAAYWMVFKDASVDGGKRTDNLPATFDGGEFPETSPSAVKPYYLPRACADCHGRSADHAKLNYLDSDHWNDRIQDDDDFFILRKESQNGVLFDGGRDTTSAPFRAAFNAIKTLNTEINDQNRAAGGEEFQVRAVANWLRIHDSEINFLSPIDRAIPAPAGNPNARVWNRQTPNDEVLLKRLDRFCFRCHSSVIYHVFDKEAVFGKKDAIALYVNLGLMPQDRKMDPNFTVQKQELLKLVNALK